MRLTSLEPIGEFMRRSIIKLANLFFIMYVVGICGCGLFRHAHAAATPEDVAVCFSPEGNCSQKLLAFLGRAQKSLDIAVYNITDRRIIKLLIAKSHEIPVRIIVDAEQAKHKNSKVAALVKARVQVCIGQQRGLMHHKFAVVDGQFLETGSYNYTNAAAFHNQENQIYLADPAIVKQYADQFNAMWKSAGCESKLLRKN